MMNHTTVTQDSSDEDEESQSEFYGRWNYIPEPVLLQIFQYLSAKDLLNAGLTCKAWFDVSHDDFLWKEIFQSDFQIDRSIGISPGKHFWLEEYKRLTCNIPLIETEVLTDHKDQVLYVSFSHNGELFATCSKDGYVMVWDSGYPSKIKYSKDMKVFSWMYTQFCQFNQSDTLLLVSGVNFSFPHSTSGEIAVFSLKDGFNLESRIPNRPYDIFGAWFSDQYLISGDLYSLAPLITNSVLWLNKASKETESDPISTELCTFTNFTGNTVRAIMIANSLSPTKGLVSNREEDIRKPLKKLNIGKTESDFRDKQPYHDTFMCLDLGNRSSIWNDVWVSLEFAGPFYYNKEYQKAEKSQLSKSFNGKTPKQFDNVTLNGDLDSESDANKIKDVSEVNVEKLLIYTSGFKTYAPHEIGIFRITPETFAKRQNVGSSPAEIIAERNRRRRDRGGLHEDTTDEPDYLIDFNGHIIGMGLSPDHRYLYVNSRPWPQNYVINDPLEPPPIAQEIDIHVIDLVTLQKAGTILRAHKAYTSNSECFFISLNVSDEYVASGAEDKHGYIWDRHYGICLAKYPHSNVVNSVAFNPRDSEMLITASDDCSIKIWRSKEKVKELNIENRNTLPKGTEMRFKTKKRRF